MAAVFTDYYRFGHITDTKTRIDCIVSTESYPLFEAMRNKANELFMYVGDNGYTTAGKGCQSDLALTKTKHISSIYRPDITNNLGYGDVNHTADALIFVFTDFTITDGRLSDGATLEVFIARGYRKDRRNVYEAFLGGELDEGVKSLRLRAKILSQKQS